jgi:hypothetical protein
MPSKHHNPFAVSCFSQLSLQLLAGRAAHRATAGLLADVLHLSAVHGGSPCWLLALILQVAGAAFQELKLPACLKLICLLLYAACS